MTFKEKLNIQKHGILLQAIYWMAFCSVQSYAAVYLSSLGYGSASIGLIVAISALVSAGVQPLLGSWVDEHNDTRLKRTSIMLAISALFFTFLLILPLPYKLIYYILAMISMVTMQPLFSALILQLKETHHSVNFGFARSFGSLAFAGISSLIGLLVEKQSAGIIPWVSLVLFTSLLLVVLRFPLPPGVGIKDGPIAGYKGEKRSGNVFTKYRGFTFAIIGFGLLFVFHNIANVFLINIVKFKGGSEAEFGYALTLMAMVEIPVMVFSEKLMQRFGTRKLLSFAVVFYVIRSTSMLLAGNMVQMYAVQLLQALSFAIYIPVSVAYVNEVMEKEDRVKGQALTVSATTLGSVAGSALGGAILESFGVVQMLGLGIASTVLGAAFVLYAVRR